MSRPREDAQSDSPAPPPPGSLAPWLAEQNRPYTTPPDGNGRPDIFAVRQALREAEEAQEVRAADDARRAAFAPLVGGAVGAELEARKQRRAVPALPVGYMAPEEARAEVKRAEQAIDELERKISVLGGKVTAELARQTQAAERAKAARVKAESVRRAIAQAEQRRATAASAGDVASVEKTTAEIAKLTTEAQAAADTATALEEAGQTQAAERAKAARVKAESVRREIAKAERRREGERDMAAVAASTAEIAKFRAEAKAADDAATALEEAAKALVPSERQHADAVGRLLDERARLAVARLALELPAVAELVRRKLGALVDGVDSAIAACACAGRAPANLHALDAGSVAAGVVRALSGGEV